MGVLFPVGILYHSAMSVAPLHFSVIQSGSNPVIPPSVGKMSIGDFTTTAGEENGEFCVIVGLATRTVGILT